MEMFLTILLIYSAISIMIFIVLIDTAYFLKTGLSKSLVKLMAYRSLSWPYLSIKPMIKTIINNYKNQ